MIRSCDYLTKHCTTSNLLRYDRLPYSLSPNFLTSPICSNGKLQSHVNDCTIRTGLAVDAFACECGTKDFFLVFFFYFLMFVVWILGLYQHVMKSDNIFL